MPGFLDQYGASDVQRERFVKWFIWGVVGALVLWFAVSVVRHNRPHRGQVRQFLAELERRDYEKAYRHWGCTADAPCRDYGFDKFLEDWGPSSRYGNVSRARVVQSQACGTGVIVTASLDGQIERLWVETADLTVGFSPWDKCPEASAGKMILDRLSDLL
ncbi:MAG: hypothetical protein IPM24_10385 [Bryobacterales bacterium]|nr:hypothetical protein [Bryobacterales bacterium]